MSEESRSDRQAEALERALSDPRAPLPSGDPELTELLQIAQNLRDLPSASFKARLGAELSRRAAVTTTATTTSPGIRSVTPYLAVRPAVELVEFAKRASRTSRAITGISRRTRPAVTFRKASAP